MKKIIALTIIMVATLFLIGFYINISSNKIKDETILNKIEQIGELVTAKQIYREVLYSKESRDFLWVPIRNKEFLISIEYNLTAGIDISKGYDVTKKDRYTLITLPKAELFSIDADDTSIKEYFIKEQFSKLTKDDYFTMINESKKKILEGKVIKTLLTESEESAKNIIKTLLQVSDIVVEVEFSNSVIKEKL